MCLDKLTHAECALSWPASADWQYLCRYESAELYWLLHDCGVPVKHLTYNKLTHGDFVTRWHPQKKQLVHTLHPCGGYVQAARIHADTADRLGNACAGT